MKLPYVFILGFLGHHIGGIPGVMVTLVIIWIYDRSKRGSYNGHD